MAAYFAPVRRWFLTRDPTGGKAVADALEAGFNASTSSSGATSSGAYLPLVTGAEPPVLVSDGAGNLIAVAFDP